MTEILKSWKSCSSKRPASQTADSTSASGVGPCRTWRSSRLSRLPALTPIRIEVPWSLAALRDLLDLVVELADVAGVDPHRGAAGVDRGEDVLRLEVDVGDDRDLAVRGDLGQGLGVVLARAGDPDDVAAGGGQLGDLLQGGVDVGGQRGASSTARRSARPRRPPPSRRGSSGSCAGGRAGRPAPPACRVQRSWTPVFQRGPAVHWSGGAQLTTCPDGAMAPKPQVTNGHERSPGSRGGQPPLTTCPDGAMAPKPQVTNGHPGSPRVTLGQPPLGQPPLTTCPDGAMAPKPQVTNGHERSPRVTRGQPPLTTCPDGAMAPKPQVTNGHERSPRATPAQPPLGQPPLGQPPLGQPPLTTCPDGAMAPKPQVTNGHERSPRVTPGPGRRRRTAARVRV